MSVYVVRAFVQLREMLASNRELARRFAQLETRLDKKLTVHDEAIAAILPYLRPSLRAIACGVRLLNGVLARVLLGDAAICQSHLLLGQSARPARPRVSRLLCVLPSVALISSCVRHTVLLKCVPVRTWVRQYFS
jgi:hypothetical protein